MFCIILHIRTTNSFDQGYEKAGKQIRMYEASSEASSARIMVYLHNESNASKRTNESFSYTMPIRVN